MHGILKQSPVESHASLPKQQFQVLAANLLALTPREHHNDAVNAIIDHLFRVPLSKLLLEGFNTVIRNRRIDHLSLTAHYQ
jgi:hypothetical protein